MFPMKADLKTFGGNGVGLNHFHTNAVNLPEL
jgi:hypothetical protein